MSPLADTATGDTNKTQVLNKNVHVNVERITRKEEGLSSLKSVLETMAGQPPPSPSTPSLNPHRVAYLAEAIADACHDHKPVSLRTFHLIVNTLGEAAAWQLIGLVKEADRDGLIHGSQGAYLIGIAKHLAKDRGLELRFKKQPDQHSATA